MQKPATVVVADCVKLILQMNLLIKMSINRVTGIIATIANERVTHDTIANENAERIQNKA